MKAPEITDEMIDHMVDELKRLHEADVEFFNSSRFKEIRRQLDKHIELNKEYHFSEYDDNIFEDVTTDEMGRFIHIMQDIRISGIQQIKTEDYFTEYVGTVDNLVFLSIYGQGSAHSIFSKERYEGFDKGNL